MTTIKLAIATLAAVVGVVSCLSSDPLATSFSPITLPVRRVPVIAALDAGHTLERHLSRGDDHWYRLPLRTGEFVRVVVEQHGIDVVAEVRDPVGNVIADVDDEVRPHAEEQVDVVAEVSGVYTIAVSASTVAFRTGSYAIRIGRRQPAGDLERAMQHSRRLRTMAARLEAQGDFEQGRRLLERSLAITEEASGADSPDAALVLLRLAENDLETRSDWRARPLLERAIRNLEQAWGPEHPYTALARARLAAVDQRAGDGTRAEATVRRSREILEQALGIDHVWYVKCLTTQSNLRVAAHDIDAAEALQHQAISILERIQNTNTIQYAVALHNLGEVYLLKLDHEAARDLFRQSLALTQALEGPESYRVTTKLQNLAIIARDERDYATALDLSTRALSIRERRLGADHADVASLLNNIASLYHATGDDSRAMPLFLRALDIREKSVGPYNMGTLNTLSNIANAYAAQGDIRQAIAFEQRAAIIVEHQLALNLAVGSERQKLSFVRGNAARTDRTISLHLNQAPTNTDAAALAALVLLQRKGRVQDAMVDMFGEIRQRVLDPDDVKLFDQLNETKAALAEIVFDVNAQIGRGDPQQSAADLDAKREQLEMVLSEHSAAFRAETQPITIDAVRAALPDDSALVEFAVFRPFDPRAERIADAYGAPRYAAYVIRRQRPPFGIDLGEATTIDHLIDVWRSALRNPNVSDANALAHAAYAAVMSPLAPALSGAKHLIVSPDGSLNLAPFEALVDDRGDYLIERYATSYLTSGRDLLRMQVLRHSANPAVIVADPAFGEPAGNTASDLPYFAPLAATGLEAQAIKRLFPSATLVTGRDATKARLQHIKSPSILHIASHGFFLDDASVDAQGPLANPLLRSGLALAGANRARPGSSSGILTALEASGLDLWGTRLVTLSACDTGVGEIKNGEGVYGLRRAFVLAGAETVVMNLWPVSDYVARDMMVTYYTGLHLGLGRGEALRNAKLTMMKRHGRQHPYFWAGLIASGQWGSLDENQ